jgi:hypothetical protein
MGVRPAGKRMRGVKEPASAQVFLRLICQNTYSMPVARLPSAVASTRVWFKSIARARSLRVGRSIGGRGRRAARFTPAVLQTRWARPLYSCVFIAISVAVRKRRLPKPRLRICAAWVPRCPQAGLLPPTLHRKSDEISSGFNG